MLGAKKRCCCGLSFPLPPSLTLQLRQNRNKKKITTCAAIRQRETASGSVEAVPTSPSKNIVIINGKTFVGSSTLEVLFIIIIIIILRRHRRSPRFICIMVIRLYLLSHTHTSANTDTNTSAPGCGTELYIHYFSPL